MYCKHSTLREVGMSNIDDFKTRFFGASTQIDKIKLCIREDRYTISTRRDKPNLNGAQYLQPILDLPSNYSCRVKPRQSGGAGANFVIDFCYKATILGNEMTIYFKGYHGSTGDLKLAIQSLRNEKEE